MMGIEIASNQMVPALCKENRYDGNRKSKLMEFDRFRTCFAANFHAVFFGLALLVHICLLGWIAAVNAPTFDEIAHVPAGLAHWHLGTFDLYRVNPPLMRMIATSPLLAINPKVEWPISSNDPFERLEFDTGRRFMQINGYNSFWYFTVCRWAQIPVSIFGGWICYQWARDLFGRTSGFVALLLWCSCPNILAWGSTITPDLGATVFGVAATYAFWRWLKAPGWNAALLAGTALGLAELSKTTWIVLFALWPVIWSLWRFCTRSQPVTRPRASQLAGILFLGLYLLNLGYGFEKSFQQLGEFRFISQALGGKDAHESPNNRFCGTWLEIVRVPVPANYLQGIDIQKYDFEQGKWSYLRGEQKKGGWWYYYLYALALKTPFGTLFLLGLAGSLIVVRREYASTFANEMVLLIPAVMVIALVSSQTGFNRYIRYVLPAVPFLYIFASRVGRAFEMNQRWPKILCGIGVVTSVVGSLSVVPHSMSFFNLAAGGPLGGPRHLLDANVDWGQDLLELKRFVERCPEVKPIRLAYFGYADPKLAGFSFESLLPSANQNGLPVLEPGWYAISVNYLFGYRHNERDNPTFTGFQQFAPDAIAGYSILIYHMTAEKLELLNTPPSLLP